MNTFKTSIIYFVLTVSICLPADLIGQEIEEAPSHGGFFMRFLLGGGPGSVDIDNKMNFKSSPGSLFHFQIGGEIGENLVLFGDIGGFSLTDPEMEWRGTTTTATDASINSVGFGIGFSYYIMPANIYFSGSVMLARTTIEYKDEKLGESEMGPGIFLSIGKEWWVGKSWGLGVAGFFEGAWLKDKEDALGYKANINNTIFGIAFTATMY